VPAKTPRPIIDRLNKEIAKAVVEPDVRQRLLTLAITAHPSTPEEMQEIFNEDLVRWKRVITDAKIEQH
jgi:tripartite-type tricarboxylate transporter receptor subunit TctC